jgi:membrane protease YdiL (CAAX protease family)
MFFDIFLPPRRTGFMDDLPEEQPFPPGPAGLPAQSPGELEPPPRPPEPRKTERIWTLWPTLGFGSLAIIIGVFASAAVYVAAAAVEFAGNPKLDPEVLQEQMEMNGDLSAGAMIVQGSFWCAAVLFFIWLRKGDRIRAYLSVTAPRLKSLLFWSALTLIYVFGAENLYEALEIDFGNEWWLGQFSSARILPLLIAGVTVFAPVSEELVFRGFLYAGIEKSRLGPAGAIILPSLIWTSLHLQYGFAFLVIIFFGGLLLGLARLFSGSIVTPLAMHVIWNTVSVIEAFIETG